MSATKSTPKAQADRLTLIEEEMLFLKKVSDTLRFLEAQVTELSGKSRRNRRNGQPPGWVANRKTDVSSDLARRKSCSYELPKTVW